MIVFLGTLVFLSLVPAAFVHAQYDRSLELAVTVVEKKWRVEVRNPKIQGDPFKAVKEHEEFERQRKETNRRNEVLIERGLPTVNPPVRPIRPNTGPQGLITTYIYEIKVRNSEKKRITKLTWEYVFYDHDTEREVGRRRFESEADIGFRQTKTVKIRSTLSPTGTLDATKADNKSRKHYSEKIEIRRVEYDDGSVWKINRD